MNLQFSKDIDDFRKKAQEQQAAMCEAMIVEFMKQTGATIEEIELVEERDSFLSVAHYYARRKEAIVPEIKKEEFKEYRLVTTGPLKIWVVPKIYGRWPEESTSAVIVADSKERALELVKDKIKEVSEKYHMGLIDDITLDDIYEIDVSSEKAIILYDLE